MLSNQKPCAGLLAKKMPDTREHRFKAFARQPAGTPVVTAAVITVEQGFAIRQRMPDIVRKLEILDFQPVRPQDRLMRHGAEGNNGLQLRHGGDFALQMAVALANFRCCRLVGRRQTAHGIGDAAIPQVHFRVRPAVDRQRLIRCGKAEAMQSWIKQFASHIAGKRTPGAIRPFFPRPQPNHQQTGVEWAKGGNRQGMPVGIAAANEGEMFSQSGTGDAILRVLECRHGGDVSMLPMQRDWDIFCRVIDNYGDIGVCWRLARQLAGERGSLVRLWVDELAALQPLCPEIDTGLGQQSLFGIEVCHWPDEFPLTQPASHVIEAFACELPQSYQNAMAAQAKPPHWINLEYLTAENWASEWHGMVSPHPSLPLRKHFFFPGFAAESGGLLRENGLFQRRDAFLAQLPARDCIDISLFCYDSAPLGELLDALIHGAQPVRCHVPPGKPLAAVARHLGSDQTQHIGNLELLPIPFLPQAKYDELLWRCAINFVRGEDSFVRAQWAGKPLVWQIYPQEEAAHLPKLEAFISTYASDLSEPEAATFRAMQMAWNIGLNVQTAWQNFLAEREQQTQAANRWAKKLENQPDLVTRLINSTVDPV